jgi:hypothetical protein
VQPNNTVLLVVAGAGAAHAETRAAANIGKAMKIAFMHLKKPIILDSGYSCVVD